MENSRLYKTFSKLVSIDSPSFGERTVCDWLKNELIGLGFDIFEDETAEKIGGSTGNLYGFLKGDPTLEPILLCAHMDTVEPSCGKECVLDDGGVITSKTDTVLGADDFAGVAEILEVLYKLEEKGKKHRPIEILFTAAEEAYGAGASHFDTSILKSKQAFVFDLAGEIGYAANKAPSVITFEVVFFGKAAHAGFAFKEGIHAVRAASAAVLAIPMGQIDHETTCNVGKIEGGGATNIIPDKCIVTGEIRSFSHEKALYWVEEIKNKIQSAVDELDKNIKFEFTFKEHIKAYETPEDSPASLRFKKACKELSLQGKLVKTFGGSDNNHLVNNAGIDGIVVANAMYDCHSIREYTRLQDMEKVTQLIMLLCE
ncbi:peptidase [Clostridia bacterium]|nr:peptidase [Clostridia bacterium]